ncbi:Caffeoyl-CoA O-methyltransferase1, partial [Zea mays]
EPDDDLRRRGAVPEHAHQAHRRQEDHGDRRLHRLLPPRHGARPPGGRHDLGHGHQPRELRAGPALHREGRRRPQDRLPRGSRAPRPRRPHRGAGEEPRVVRLRLRGRRQGQLPQLPRAAAEAGEAGRPHRLRQHAVERLRRAPRRRAHAQVHPLLPRLRARPQQGARRRRPRRDLPAPRRRRRHPLPPRQVKTWPGLACPTTATDGAAGRILIPIIIDDPQH